MRKPKTSIDLAYKLSPSIRCQYWDDYLKICKAENKYIKLQEELYRKIWPLKYSAIPKKLLARYKIVLRKLGNLVRMPLREFILDNFDRLENIKKEINSWEAIADTLEFYSEEKGFNKRKQRSEIFNVLICATYDKLNNIIKLWELLKNQPGYTELEKEDISSIYRYYKRRLSRRQRN